jgi:hypothetical protein
MAEYFTVRNTVILALTQVGVIVAGVLTAGACQKWNATLFHFPARRDTELLAEYGFLALVLPLAWAAALYLLRQSEDPGAAGVTAFSSGVLLLVLLLLGVVYAAVAPLCRMIGFFG